ncbi:MAG: alpha/beta hydrolase [Chloroflexi bacterium]|nr:alpha/beta hydrolase [Chloroflexota bacterium]
MAPRYAPTGEYQVQARDVVYRRDGDRDWLATLYQPQGTGPFPALLDVHGGVWSGGSRASDALIDQSLAASGIVVLAIDFRLAPQHPYPAQVADVHYATRWLKAHARDFNADAATVGGLGASSGGHTVLLSALRPHDSRYAALPLPEAAAVDARLTYVVACWPVIDSYARYLYARRAGIERLANLTEGYFLTEAAMREGNPQELVERGEAQALPSVLIIQGTADANIPLEIPNRFAETYRAAGGHVELELFPDMPHGFANHPGPESERALALMKSFVARQLAATAAAV